jgi:hypothetical protein
MLTDRIREGLDYAEGRRKGMGRGQRRGKVSYLAECIAAPCKVTAAVDEGGSVVTAHAQPHHEQVAQLARLVNGASRKDKSLDKSYYTLSIV